MNLFISRLWNHRSNNTLATTSQNHYQKKNIKLSRKKTQQISLIHQITGYKIIGSVSPDSPGQDAEKTDWMFGSQSKTSRKKGLTVSDCSI